MPPFLRLIFALVMVAAFPGFAADLKDQIATVEELRGLTFTGPIEQRTIERTELRKFLIAQLEKELPIPVADYLRVLDALELIENNAETLDRFLGLYEAQVLAFYDPTAHVYVSLSQPPSGIELNEMMTGAVTVHELTHALQDQRFDAGRRIMAMKGNSDAQMAYQAVLEGEATLVMAGALFAQLGQSLDALVRNETLLSSMDALADMNPGIPEDVPRYFVESMKFPYLAGFRFVIEAYRRGGWKAVDALHRKPPLSSEQVLHPELYFDAKPASKPDSFQSADRKTLLEETLGEFSWRFLLGEKAADGWGGDSLQVVSAPAGKLTFYIETSWDTEPDAKEFSSAYRDFLASKSIEADIHRRGRRVSVSFTR